MIKFFYDTYAIVSYLDGNKKYSKYFSREKGVTTKLNLMELYYAVLRTHGAEKAEHVFDSFLPTVIEVTDDVMKRAMTLRLNLQRQKKNVSYVEAIGYQLSLDKKIKFLTGDKEFKGMPNVEYIK